MTDEEIEAWWTAKHRTRPSTAPRGSRPWELEPDAPVRCVRHFCEPSECDEPATHAFAEPQSYKGQVFVVDDRTPMVCARHADEEDVEVGTMSRIAARRAHLARMREEHRIDVLTERRAPFGPGAAGKA